MSSTVGTQLSELFSIFTEQLLEEVRTAKEAGMPIAAADKAAIIRFLQINDITFKPQDDDSLAALRARLTEASKSKNASALEVLRAANEDLNSLYGNGNLQ